LVRCESAPGEALIQVDTKGQNSIAVASDANFQLTSNNVDKTMQSIGKFDVLFLPLDAPLEKCTLPPN
jgi:sugar/nucleoside kinase (ribokinase family)